MSTINPNFSNNPIQPDPKTAAPAAPKADATKAAATDRVELAGTNYRGLDKLQKLDGIRAKTASQPIGVSVYLKNAGEGASAAPQSEISDIKKYAEQNGLQVTSVDPDTNVVKLSGSVDSLQGAFGVKLEEFKDQSGQIFHAYEGNLSLPKELAGAVQTVVGLNNRPIAHPHNTGFVADQTGITAKDAPSSGYLPNAVSKAENFPANDGKGSNISFVELGGGYKQSDLNAAWKADGIKNGPQFKDFSVDGATNSPEGSLNGADGEVYLDAEVAGAQAPGANFEMDWAPNSAQGFMDGTREAGQRQIAAGKPGAVSISWGAPEAEAFSVADMQAFDGVLKNLADKGVNVYVASGDNGSVDGAQDGKDHVDFPSASTNVVSVGGTKLELGSDGKRESEVAWGDIAIGEGASGGGFSNVFGQPDYQTKDGIKVPDGIAQGGGRGVPDIAGNAAPSTGYHVTGEGQGGSIGGTSGAAPSAAALDATLRTGLGGQNIGFLNPTVYAHPEVFTKITEGTNGTYSANADGSWNAVTGLGVPDGQKLLEVLKQKGAAENPTA